MRKHLKFKTFLLLILTAVLFLYGFFLTHINIIRINPQNKVDRNPEVLGNLLSNEITREERIYLSSGKEDDYLEEPKVVESRESSSEYYTEASFSNLVISSTPTGKVEELKISDIEVGTINLIDLSNYNLEYFAFIWDSGEFRWGLSDTTNIPDLKVAEVSDDFDDNSGYLVSDLLYFDDKHYLFIEETIEVSELKIHLISSSDIEPTFDVTSAPSNYNSGPKYSTLNIIPRESWSGDPNINDPRLQGNGGRLVWEPYYYDVNKIVVHHTATPNYRDPIEDIRAVYSYHTYSVPWCAEYSGGTCIDLRHGWGDIGYNYLIDYNGNIYEGKLGGDEAKGYHASSGNLNSIGVSVMGTYSTITPSPAAQDALRNLIAEKGAFYDFDPQWDSTVYGHRKFQTTECPGQAFYNILPSISDRARSYKDSHFSQIKDVVAKVNDAVDNGDYAEGQLILVINQDATISTLGSLIPFYNNQPVSWTGVWDYMIEGEKVYLTISYNTGTQSTTDRLRTLYKIYWLRNDVEIASLNFIYSPQHSRKK